MSTLRGESAEGDVLHLHMPPDLKKALSLPNPLKNRRTPMPRPPLPESDLHERSFRVRLKDDDAALLMALAKKADIPPAVLLRTMIVRQLPVFAMMRKVCGSAEKVTAETV
jgi:hypothetical protein